MSLFDHYAAAALQGLLASDNDGNTGVVWGAQLNRRAGVFAKLACELALAMLREREGLLDELKQEYR